MNRVNEETLMAKRKKQANKKVVGADGVTKEEYDQNASENIADLIQRMKQFSY